MAHCAEDINDDEHLQLVTKKQSSTC